MNHEDIMLRERNRSKRNKCYMTLFVRRLKNEGSQRKIYQWMLRSGRNEWIGQIGATAKVCIILSR